MLPTNRKTTMPSFISSSELVPHDLRSLLSEHPIVHISGIPLYYEQDEKSYYYNQCPALIRVPILWSTVSIVSIPTVGHRHLDLAFLGEYPTITGQHYVSENSYIFGVRPELSFSAEYIPSPEYDLA